MWIDSGKGEGIWKERVDDVTGESSIKEHKPKVVWKSCKQGDHSFRILGNRELECTKCNIIRKFQPHKDKSLLKKHGIN